MKRYKHSLSNYSLMTADMGKLYPCGLTEVIPGDTFRHKTSALIRLSPLVSPVMHPVTVRIHHWFVPMRIIFPQWEDFITGGPDGNDVTQLPKQVLSGTAKKSLYDYMGVKPVDGLEVNALPVFAYNKIVNEFYRDQDLVAERANNDGSIFSIAWEKDYFTSSRPWTQKGDDILLPIGERAPIKGIGIATPGSTISSTPGNYTESDGEVRQYNGNVAGDAGFHIEIPDPLGDGIPNAYADLSQAAAVSIQQFREAFALQRYQEARARYGSRYTEYLRYLGVRSSDSRLQRPEYLGGGKQTISFSEILGTYDGSAGGGGTLGQLGGHGIAAMRSNAYQRFFEEHGYVLSLMSVRPKTIYADGVPRTFLKETKEEYWQKELEQIGQQEVFNNEVYADPADGMNVFGYADRYNEYKRQPSIVTGEFRDVLDYWHMARKFQAKPALNSSFVTCDPTKRIFASTDEQVDSLYCMVHHNLKARRLVRKGSGSVLK